MSDKLGQTPDWDNSENGDADEEKLRQLVNRELLNALDAASFQSRRTAVIAEVRQGQSRTSGDSSRRRERSAGWFGVPTWAATMAAVFVLVVVGVVFAIVAGNNASTSSSQPVAQAPEVNRAAATAPAAAQATQAFAAATNAPAAAAGAAQDSNATKQGTQTASTGSSAPRPTTVAAAATTAPAAAATTAAVALAPPAASPTAAATAPPAATIAAASGQATNSLALPVYPQATSVNISNIQIESFLAANSANVPPDVKNETGLNLPFTSNIATYNYQSSKVKAVNAEQVADFYLKQLPTPAFNQKSLVLRDDNVFKVRWLYFTTPQNQPFAGFLIVEPKQQAAVDVAFGVGQISVGETLIITARR